MYPSFLKPEEIKELDEIKQWALEFREGMLEDRKSNNWCYMISAPLQGLLALEFSKHKFSLCSINLKNCKHWIIGVDDYLILDATADQLNVWDKEANLPPVYLGVLPDIYQKWAIEAQELDLQD